MKNILISLFSVLVLSITANAQVKNVSVNEFEEMIQQLSTNEVLLDVRSKSELKDGFITGMTNLDFHSKDFEAQVDKLDKNKTYYVYCAAGGRSFKAAKMLNEKGINLVYNLNGGIIAWNKEGKKITK